MGPDTTENDILVGVWIDDVADEEDFTNDTIIELSNNNEGESVRDE